MKWSGWTLRASFQLIMLVWIICLSSEVNSSMENPVVAGKQNVSMCPEDCRWPVKCRECSFKCVLLKRSNSVGTCFQLQQHVWKQKATVSQSTDIGWSEQRGESTLSVCWSCVRFPRGYINKGAVWAGGLKRSQMAAVACEKVDMPNNFLHI